MRDGRKFRMKITAKAAELLQEPWWIWAKYLALPVKVTNIGHL